MSIKRLLILLLSCLLLACLALSACGEEETSSEAGSSAEESSEAESSETESLGAESSEEESSKGTVSSIVLPEDSSEEESSEAESSEAESSEEESSEAESSEASNESDESEESSEDTSEESSEDTSSEEESSEDTSSEVSPDTDPYRDNEGNFTLNELQMPPFEFADDLFTVLVYGDNLQKTYYSEEIAAGIYGTRIENFVKLRNRDILADYGVEIGAYRVDDVAETLRNDALADTVDYDAAMPFLRDAIGLGQDQLLYNLRNFGDIIHLQAPWWDQTANDPLTFEGKLYFAVGDASFSNKKASAAVLFNKTLADDLSIDFYAMVRNKTWTLDALYEAGKLLTADIDGTPGMGFPDTWGVVSSYDIALYHYLASGKQILTTNTSGVPKVTIGDATGLTTTVKVIQTLQNTGALLVVETLSGDGTANWDLGRSVFTSGRALFYVDTLASVDGLRAGEDVEFGILPMPLHSSKQQSYSTPVMGQYAYGFCIPRNVANAHFSAYMMEVLACYSKNTVTPEYEEGLLRSAHTVDWDSREMLEIIFSSMTYDLGVTHGMGGAGTLLPDMFKDNTTAVASRIYGRIPDIEAAITEYQKQYRT